MTTLRATSVDTHVGKCLRMRRMMAGISQTKLADALGITFQQVQKYEKGVNRISASKLQQSAEFLQVPIKYFLEGVPGNHQWQPLPPDHLSDFLATRDGVELVKAFMRIADQKTLRRRIIALVEEIADYY